jgi:N-acetyl-anhydromuramyl-L-alanine amidase AmpD
VGQQSTQEAGPGLDPGTADILYRDLEVGFHLDGGKVKPDSVGVNGEVTWGDGFGDGPLRISVDWKPDWFQAKAHKPRTAGVSPTFVVIHRTDAPNPPVMLFRLGNDQTSAHYVVDVDGHITKMVKDDEISNHAGSSFYDGQQGLNQFSIGIEQTSKSDTPYPPEQLAATRRLVKALRAAFPGIPRKHVVGHVDVSVANTDPTKGAINLSLGGRGPDPGPEFDWPALGDDGSALRNSKSFLLLVSPNIESEMYGGFFQQFPDEHLKLNDSDAQVRFGGKPRKPDMTGKTPIAELQADLRSIGYAIDGNDGKTITGKYSSQTNKAVARFRMHFFSGRNRPPPPAGQTKHPPAGADLNKGDLDLDTAIAIKAVLIDLSLGDPGF